MNMMAVSEITGTIFIGPDLVLIFDHLHSSMHIASIMADRATHIPMYPTPGDT